MKRSAAQSEATLQDALDDAAWDTFRSCADGIDMLADVAVSFVSTLASDIETDL